MVSLAEIGYSIGQLPIIQLVIVIIIIYLMSLGVRTIKAYLRLLEVKAIAKEVEIINRGGEKLEREVKKRIGIEGIIKKSLGKEKK